ncbi:hypothetical protein L484_001348 [Morus notabilis]|uniref:Uncharacterized protein n=1 Tax=Morus notabilis TaxID=981085 RepID=W9RMH8_9ROSA|nr:hypothetical protein L484_001348 [Morus notabilis]
MSEICKDGQRLGHDGRGGANPRGGDGGYRREEDIGCVAEGGGLQIGASFGDEASRSWGEKRRLGRRSVIKFFTDFSKY